MRKTTRRVLQVLADMPDPNFAALVESLPARGGTITMKELVKATAMSPPRRPRGEKPATTIRLQRQQIKNLSNIITELRQTLAGKVGQAAVDESARTALAEEVERYSHRCADQAGRIADLTQQLRASAERLAFLEGYYAKSTETIAGTTARNPGALPPGEQDHEGKGLQARP